MNVIIKLNNGNTESVGMSVRLAEDLFDKASEPYGKMISIKDRDTNKTLCVRPSDISHLIVENDELDNLAESMEDDYSIDDFFDDDGSWGFRDI